jgi:hypothetical protein
MTMLMFHESDIPWIHRLKFKPETSHIDCRCALSDTAADRLVLPECGLMRLAYIAAPSTAAAARQAKTVGDQSAEALIGLSCPKEDPITT